MKKKAIAVALLFAFALFKPMPGFAANGQYVSTTIAYAQSSAISNAIWNVVNPIEMDGTNRAQSLHTLVVQCKSQINNQIDPVAYSLFVPPGGYRTTYKVSPSLAERKAYVYMFPQFAARGCTGVGELWD